MKPWLILAVVILGLLATAIVISTQEQLMDAARAVRQSSAQSDAQPADKRVPVVVELFTSEGCSSCPPADEVLARLERAQPVAGAEIIWNKAVAAITNAARAPKADVRITGARKTAGAVSLQARADALPALTDGDTVDLLLAVTESDLSSNVSRGENAGRRLNHRTVVRRLGLIGSAEAKQGASFSAETTVTLAKGWKPENLRAVAFLQERKNRRVIGAGVVKMSFTLY